MGDTIPANIAANVYGNPPNKFAPKVTNGIVGLSTTAGTSQATALASNAAFQAGFSAGDTLNQLKAAVPAGVTFSTPTLYVNPNNYHTIKTLGMHELRVALHPEVSVTVTANVAQSPEEAEMQAKGITPVRAGDEPEAEEAAPEAPVEGAAPEAE